MPALQDAYKGGDYWGGIGRDPDIDRYFDSGQARAARRRAPCVSPAAGIIAAFWSC